MKHVISILFSLGQIAAAARTLSVRDEFDTDCFALDNVGGQQSAYNSYGLCAHDCASAGHPVFAVRGEYCTCLDGLPSDDKKKDASECNEPCPGYASQMCGGDGSGLYSVGRVDAFEPGSSETTNTTVTSTAVAASTVASVSTETISPSGVPLNNNNSATTPSTSATGRSPSASPTIVSSNAAAAGFGPSITAISSIVYAMAVLVALI